MRPVVYYVASTLDGFIAREDGSFSEFPWDDAYLAGLQATYPETFPAPFRDEDASREDNRRFDTVLMGRKTYEVGLADGLTSPYPTLDQYVFSRTLKASPDPAVNVIADDALEVVRQLKDEGGGATWICGGSSLATALFDGGVVDEIIVKLNPIVFGSGVPLFASSQRASSLRLLDSQVYDSGHVVLSYAVNHVRADA